MSFVVAGATGNVGHHLVQQLHQAGRAVRALTRNPAKAEFPAGVQVVQGDLMLPESLEEGLAGAEGLHLIDFGGEDFSPLQTGPEIADLAERSGVKRVSILMSDEKGDFARSFEDRSFAVTFIRATEFMSNVKDFAPQVRSGEPVRVPYVDRRSAMVHDADIASVAMVALTQDGQGGKTYTVSGGEVLTPRDMLRTVGEAIGREIPIQPLTEEEAIQDWQNAGLSQGIIDFMVWVYGNTPESGYTVTLTVPEVTGKPHRTLKQWATENTDLFR